jgi:hypothetical protein
VANKPVLSSQQQSAFNNALQTGIQEKNMDMIRLALENGAEPSLLLFAGLQYKPTWKDSFNYDEPKKKVGLEWVKTAVEYGADVNTTKDHQKKAWHAIFWANDENSYVLDFMFEKGVAIDTPNPSGNTLLMSAVLDGKEAMVRYYLDKGANPMQPCGEKGETFPLKALQESEKFKKGKKNELLMLMMKKARAAEEAAPETSAAPAPADAGVTLTEDMEVPRPLALRAQAKPAQGKNFAL